MLDSHASSKYVEIEDFFRSVKQDTLRSVTDLTVHV